MTIKYNEKQKEVIGEPLDKNILVSASAGSGKTSILVERILNLLSENPDISLKNMVIMTFTKKATAEMKKKIKEKIEERLKENPDNKKLITESAYISSANIMTIDSFCKKILEENYENLSPDNSLYSSFDISYRVADEKELNILYNDVLDDLIEKKYTDEKYKKFFNAYIEKCNDKLIKELFIRGLFFLSSIPFADKFLQEKIDNFEKDSIDIHRTYIAKLFEELKNTASDIEALDDLYEFMDESSHNLEEAKKTDKKTYQDVCSLKDNFIPKVIEILKEIKKIDSCDEENIKYIYDKYEELAKPSFPRKDWIMVSDENAYIDAKNAVSKIYEDLAIVVEIFEMVTLPKEIICNENEKTLLMLLKEFYSGVIVEKKKKNVIAISDYAMLSLDILYDKVNNDGKFIYEKSDLSKEISKRYKAVFVDEYQDTNYIQELVLSAITDSFNADNVFMVGDIKQSIYAFRNAEPKIFAEKFDLYKEAKGGKLITLDTNYRSNASILKYVNHLFSNIMYKDYGDVDYKNDGAFKIENADTKEKNVELDFVCKADTIIEDDETENIEYEAEYVARKIQELVSSGKYSYKDIVILLRSTKGRAEYFIDALTRYNIPAYSELNKGFYNRFEIKLLISLLKVIDNPLQNVPLACVLTSEIFDIKNKELALLKIIYQEAIVFGKGEKFMLYDSIKYFLENFDNIESKYNDLGVDISILNSKIDRFITYLDDFRFKARYLSISELLNLIYDKTDAKNIVRRMIDGKMRVANLDILYKNAKSYENSSFIGLFNFLRYIEKILSREDDQGQAKLLDEQDNVVRIMTIHTSKGLQFPVVFLSNMEKTYNFADSNSVYYYDKNLGVCLEYIDDKERFGYKPAKLRLAKKISKDKTNQEEMRMLYVALTRAKDKIFMTCFVKDGKEQSKSFNSSKLETLMQGQKVSLYEDIKEANSYLDLVVTNLSNDLCEVKKVVIEGIETNPVVVDKNKVSKKTKEEYTYKYQDLSKISPKFSVSAIKESSHITNYDTSIYEEESVIDDMTDDYVRVNGAEMGTAYHRFMEFFDYDKKKYVCEYESKSRAHCDDLVSNEKIEAFLSTDIGKRMKDAFLHKKLYREHKFMKLFSQDDINEYLNNNKEKQILGLDKEISEKKQVIIQGIIDAFFIEKGADGSEYIVLVDYKTDKIMKKDIGDKDTFKKYLIDNYAVQLNIYSDVLADLTGLTVNEKYIYSFALDELIKL